VEGVEDDIAAARLVEARAVAAVRVGDDGAIPTREDATQQPRNRRGLAGAGRADELEVAGLLAGVQANPRECQGGSHCPPAARDRSPGPPSGENLRTALVDVRRSAAQRESGRKQQRG